MSERFIEGRYPYTYAWDMVRVWASESAEMNDLGFRPSVISRAGASQMCGKIADAMGVDKANMAESLADAYLKEYGIEKP